MKTVAQTVIEADRFYTIAAKGGSVIQAVEKATNGGDIRLGKYEHKPEQEWAFVRDNHKGLTFYKLCNGSFHLFLIFGIGIGSCLVKHHNRSIL